MLGIETMYDMYEVENGANFEEYDYHEYNHKNKWGLSAIQFIGWVKKHECGTPKQKVWIENMLTDINFHTEARMLARSEYDLLIDEIKEW